MLQFTAPGGLFAPEPPLRQSVVVPVGLSTAGLVGVTWLALRERSYSAVMAATGLLYLAILTGFGTDLVARAVLNP